jgi:alpha-tubulin suppressor-like RCC1 family protein
MPLYACNGCVKNLFVTEEEFIERFTGKQLWASGYNFAGELGSNNRVNRSSPVQTISGGTNWKQAEVAGVNINSIGAHTAGIKTDGTLWTWGRGAIGLLGNNSSAPVSSPVQTVSGGTNWKQVSVGGYNTGAIKTDGTLWMWGLSAGGKLGNQNITTCQSSPVQTISGGTNWKQLSVGYSSVGAIKTDGTLWMWGNSLAGGLGDGFAIARSSPVQTVSGGTNWKSVSADGNNAGAIKTDGTLWLWGSGSSGQLGNNNLAINVSSPVQTVSGGTNWRSVEVSIASTAAIKTDGTLWVWGVNTDGKLGINSVASRSSPVQTVSGGTNWRKVCMSHFNVAAIKTDGTLWLWGTNLRGELGNDNRIVRSFPVQTISGGTGWRDASFGVFTSLGLKIED